MMRLIGFVFLLSLFAGCGTSASMCGPSNCNGCCDAQGQCQQPSPLACGGNGAACQVCQLGTSCVSGACFGGSTGTGGGTATGTGGGSSTGTGGGSSTGTGGGDAATGGGSATGGGAQTSGGGTGSTGGGNPAVCSPTCPASFMCTSGECTGGALTGINIDEVGHEVSGTITVNGAAPTRDATYCAASANLNDVIGTITFTEPLRGYTTSYTLTCANTANGFNWSVVLPPGSYDVRIARGQWTTNASVNLLAVNYLARTGFVIDAPKSNVALEQFGHAISGTITVNGAPPTRDAAYCAASANLNDVIGTITFTEPTRAYTTTYTLTCSNTSNGFEWSVVLPPGSYDVRIARGQWTANANVNLLAVNYLARSAFVVSGPQANVVLAEVGHAISGTITVNGAPPTRDAAYCAASANLNDVIGTVTFNEPTRGYTATYTLTCTNTANGFNWSLVLPPGAYDVRVARGQWTTNANVNLLAVNYLARSAFMVSGPQANVVLAEVGHDISGTITVNGAPPTRDAAYCATAANLNDVIGTVTFNELTRGYTATYTLTCANTSSGFNWSLMLAPGSYEVRIARGQWTTNANVNLLAVNYLARTGFMVSAPQNNVVLEEFGHQISGSVRVDGVAPTRDAAYCAATANVNDVIGTVTFTEPTRGYTATYTFTCANTASGFNWSLQLPPGSYDVRVTRGQWSTNAGVNLMAVNYLARTALTVNGPQSNVVLEQVGRQLSGTVTVNGAPPTRDEAYCNATANLNDVIGTVVFTEPTLGYTATWTFTCSNTTNGFNWSLLLPPGSYEVRVARGQWSANANVNLLAVNYLGYSRLRVP